MTPFIAQLEQIMNRHRVLTPALMFTILALCILLHAYPASAAQPMIAAGAGHTLALKSDGALWAWGYNNHGELGLGDTTDRHSPVQVGVDSDWTASCRWRVSYCCAEIRRHPLGLGLQQSRAVGPSLPK